MALLQEEQKKKPTMSAQQDPAPQPAPVQQQAELTSAKNVNRQFSAPPIGEPPKVNLSNPSKENGNKKALVSEMNKGFSVPAQNINRRTFDASADAKGSTLDVAPDINDKARSVVKTIATGSVFDDRNPTPKQLFNKGFQPQAIGEALSNVRAFDGGDKVHAYPRNTFQDNATKGIPALIGKAGKHIADGTKNFIDNTTKFTGGQALQRGVDTISDRLQSDHLQQKINLGTASNEDRAKLEQVASRQAGRVQAEYDPSRGFSPRDDYQVRVNEANNPSGSPKSVPTVTPAVPTVTPSNDIAKTFKKASDDQMAGKASRSFTAPANPSQTSSTVPATTQNGRDMAPTDKQEALSKKFASVGEPNEIQRGFNPKGERVVAMRQANGGYGMVTVHGKPDTAQNVAQGNTRGFAPATQGQGDWRSQPNLGIKEVPGAKASRFVTGQVRGGNGQGYTRDEYARRFYAPSMKRDQQEQGGFPKMFTPKTHPWMDWRTMENLNAKLIDSHAAQQNNIRTTNATMNGQNLDHDIRSDANIIDYNEANAAIGYNRARTEGQKQVNTQLKTVTDLQRALTQYPKGSAEYKAILETLNSLNAKDGAKAYNPYDDAKIITEFDPKTGKDTTRAILPEPQSGGYREAPIYQ